MTAYAFNVTSGDWNVSTNWSPNGVPGAADTVSFSGAARKIIIPTGYTAQVLGITYSGSNTSNRGEIEIQGALELYGDAEQTTWTTLNINGGILDVRGFYWRVNQADGSGKRAEVLVSNGGKIFSSTTLGGFTGLNGATGDPGSGTLSLEDCKIENVHFRYGSAWYPGNKFVIDNVVFYNCGIVQHEPYIDDAADWIVRNVTFDGTQASGDYKCYLSCRDKGGTITGQRIFQKVVWNYSAGSGTRIIRLRWFPAIMAPSKLYVYRAFIEGGLNYTTVDKLFSVPNGGLVGEALAGVTNSYFFTDRDNPHTLQNMCENVNGCIIEATYGAGYTDAADHFVLTAAGTFVIQNTIIIDGAGGACLNALNSTFNGSYTFKHNTYVADVEDEVYGQWCRTENFGEFSTGATLNIHSNISYARSNPSGAANIRVLNIEEAGDDQVDLMDNNCVFGMGSTLSTLFYGVTSATKGSYGSQAGWGANDLIGTDPEFVDDERGLMSWADIYGISDQDAAIKKLIYDVNGYNSTTHDHDLTPGADLDELLEHVREGYSPTNIALKDAGYDSVTIGALEHLASGVTGNVSVTESNDSVSSSGALAVAGALATAEASDSVASVGSASITALTAITEQVDGVASVAQLSVAAALAVAEQNDAVSAAATAESASVTGNLTVTEAGDSVSSSGALSIAGSSSVAESSDAASSGASVSLQGALASTEQADLLAGASTLGILANAAIGEAADGLVATGLISVPDVTTGHLSVTETGDSVLSSGALSISSALSATESNDTAIATAQIFVFANFAVAENNDSLSASDGEEVTWVPVPERLFTRERLSRDLVPESKNRILRGSK